MYVNIIKSYRDVVAVCDKELLGKKFEELFKGNIRQLDVKENFYRSSPEAEMATEEQVLEIINLMAAEDATFNIVGKKSVSVALKSGIITKESVGKVKGIPFALVLI